MEPVYIRRKKPINRKTKLNLVFDEEARKDFLTGFRKRKLQRQKKAQDELKDRLKEEKKRIKHEAQTAYKKLKLSFQPIPEVEELLRSTTKEYEIGDHSVSVVEFTTDVLQKRNKIIGTNKVEYEEPEVKKESESEESEDELPGMPLKTRREIKKEIKKQATEHVKKSKVYQLKNRIEQQKQRKKSLQEKHRKMKIQMKSKKGRRNKNKSSF